MNEKLNALPLSKRLKRWICRYRVETGLALLGLLSMNAILLAKAYRQTDQIDPAIAGQFGDFVGGYVGTAFVLLTALLLYRTLRTQRDASELQFFEGRFFELMRLHRANIDEMAIGQTRGRRVFLLMLRELWAAHSVVDSCAQLHSPNLGSRERLHVAYYCLFFGVGVRSSRMLRVALHSFDASFIDAVDKEMRDPALRAIVKKKYGLKYAPFEGHQSRLGHYYRHLYQTVCYVNRQVIAIDRYDYLKTLRAQLSTHEQALLLINSLCPIGRKWWEEDLIVKYRLVKNLPLHFIDPSVEIDFRALFPEGYFEWEKSSAGFSNDQLEPRGRSQGEFC
jgi:hypothetical protein